MKKVLVIVVTYNGMRWLERCLSSVMSDSTGKLQTDLYVLDNDSTDGSADYVQAHFPKAKLVRSAENLGFSKANNLGFRYALDKGYDYVYLLNQDAWLAPGALETLVAAAEAHPDYAVLSPLQMTDGYKSLDPQFAKILRRSAPQNDSFHPSFCHPEGGNADRRISRRTDTPESVLVTPECGSTSTVKQELVSVRRIMAAHGLVPVGALRKVGLFEEELFPLYGQDDDWCNRARYHGLKIGVVPEARGVHDRAQRAEAKEKIIHRNYYTGSLVRLCDINRPLWERFCYVCLFTLVKAAKYFSFQPLKYFLQICRLLPTIRSHRSLSKGQS